MQLCFEITAYDGANIDLELDALVGHAVRAGEGPTVGLDPVAKRTVCSRIRHNQSMHISRSGRSGSSLSCLQMLDLRTKATKFIILLYPLLSRSSTLRKSLHDTSWSSHRRDVLWDCAPEKFSQFQRVDIDETHGRSQPSLQVLESCFSNTAAYHIGFQQPEQELRPSSLDLCVHSIATGR